VYSGGAWFEYRPEYRPSWGCRDLPQPLRANVEIVPRLRFISFFLNLCHSILTNVPYRAHRYTDNFVKYRKNEHVPSESCQVVTVKELLFSRKRIGVAAKSIARVQFQHPDF